MTWVSKLKILERRERSERSTEEQGDATQTFRPSGSRGCERGKTAFEKAAGKTAFGAIHISVVARSWWGHPGGKKVERQFWWTMNFRGHDRFRSWRKVLKGAGLEMYRPFDLSGSWPRNLVVLVTIDINRARKGMRKLVDSKQILMLRLVISRSGWVNFCDFSLMMGEHTPMGGVLLDPDPDSC